MLPKTLAPGFGAGVGGGGGAPARPCGGAEPRPEITGTPQPRQGTVSHTPERSGLPSAVFGAGASRSTLPSAVFGTVETIWRGHCASRVGERLAARVRVAAMKMRDTVRASRAEIPAIVHQPVY